jgi:hypothetical protein
MDIFTWQEVALAKSVFNSDLVNKARRMPDPVDYMLKHLTAVGYGGPMDIFKGCRSWSRKGSFVVAYGPDHETEILSVSLKRLALARLARMYQLGMEELL